MLIILRFAADSMCRGFYEFANALKGEIRPSDDFNDRLIFQAKDREERRRRWESRRSLTRQNSSHILLESTQ